MKVSIWGSLIVTIGIMLIVVSVIAILVLAATTGWGWILAFLLGFGSFWTLVHWIRKL
jgi:hypothetical protein